MDGEPGGSAHEGTGPAGEWSPGSSMVTFLVAGAYLALVGAYRAIEVLPLVFRNRVEGYPEWLLPYLALISLLVFAAGVALFLTGLGVRRKAMKLAGVSGRLGALFLAVFALLHTFFLLRHEHSFADGGLIWGFLHILTLTRLPTTGTEAGILGYQIGTGLGMIVWFVCSVGMFLLTVASTRVKREDRPVGLP